MIGSSAAFAPCVEQAARVQSPMRACCCRANRELARNFASHIIEESFANGPFVKVNCALFHELIESELFGHRRVRFTGAAACAAESLSSRWWNALSGRGRGFARGISGELLRVLQEGEFQRVGGETTVR